MVKHRYGESVRCWVAIDMRAIQASYKRRSVQRTGGFTLIELLVAISLLALMSVMTWRGIDGIAQAQRRLQQHGDAVQALQATLGQWGADLDALATQPNWNSLQWDGRSLRLLRRSPAGDGVGLRVVAWARRGVGVSGQWLRWQSDVLRTRAELDLAWQQAQTWAQTPGADDAQREVATIALNDWQIFFYRGNAWTNPLSSAGAAQDGARVGASPALPEGVRLVLHLPQGYGLDGVLTRDWARPVLGGSL